MSNSNRTLLYVGIGCGLLLVVAACVIGSCFYCAADAFSGPHGAAKSFFKDIRDQNYPQALQRMNPIYQQTHTPASFQQALAAHPAIAQHTDGTFMNINIQNSGGRIEGFLTTPTGNVPVTLGVSKVGDYWYIDSLLIQNVPLQ